MSESLRSSARSSSVVITLCVAARRILASTLGPPYFGLFGFSGPTAPSVAENALRGCVGLLQEAQVVRQALGRELVEREADALAARAVQQDDVGGVLGVALLRVDAELGPHVLQRAVGAQEEVHAARDVVLAHEHAGAV